MSVLQAAQEVVIVLIEARDKVEVADTRPNGLRSTWRTRVALCRAILAVRQVSLRDCCCLRDRELRMQAPACVTGTSCQLIDMCLSTKSL